MGIYLYLYVLSQDSVGAFCRAQALQKHPLLQRSIPVSELSHVLKAQLHLMPSLIKLVHRAPGGGITPGVVENLEEKIRTNGGETVTGVRERSLGVMNDMSNNVNSSVPAQGGAQGTGEESVETGVAGAGSKSRRRKSLRSVLVAQKFVQQKPEDTFDYVMGQVQRDNARNEERLIQLDTNGIQICIYMYIYIYIAEHAFYLLKSFCF